MMGTNLFLHGTGGFEIGGASGLRVRDNDAAGTVDRRLHDALRLRIKDLDEIAERTGLDRLRLHRDPHARAFEYECHRVAAADELGLHQIGRAQELAGAQLAARGLTDSGVGLPDRVGGLRLRTALDRDVVLADRFAAGEIAGERHHLGGFKDHAGDANGFPAERRAAGDFDVGLEALRARIEGELYEPRRFPGAGLDREHAYIGVEIDGQILRLAETILAGCGFSDGALEFR